MSGGGDVAARRQAENLSECGVTSVNVHRSGERQCAGVCCWAAISAANDLCGEEEINKPRRLP